jgi:hypothetical protein
MEFKNKSRKRYGIEATNRDLAAKYTINDYGLWSEKCRCELSVDGFSA